MKKVNIVYIYMILYYLRGLYTSLACGGGDISISRKLKKLTCIIFSSVLRSHKCGFIFFYI